MAHFKVDLKARRSYSRALVVLDNGPGQDRTLIDWLVRLLLVATWQEEADPTAAFWPASVHIIGKDITWFHCVIWPSMLKSAGLTMPKTVFAHGFVSAEDGRKMSKSLGNVVDPHQICNQ